MSGRKIKPLPFRGGVGVGTVMQCGVVDDLPRPPAPFPEGEGER
jgi:hypothetical protein